MQFNEAALEAPQGGAGMAVTRALRKEGTAIEEGVITVRDGRLAGGNM